MSRYSERAWKVPVDMLTEGRSIRPEVQLESAAGPEYPVGLCQVAEGHPSVRHISQGVVAENEIEMVVGYARHVIAVVRYECDVWVGMQLRSPVYHLPGHVHSPDLGKHLSEAGEETPDAASDLQHTFAGRLISQFLEAVTGESVGLLPAVFEVV